MHVATDWHLCAEEADFKLRPSLQTPDMKDHPYCQAANVRVEIALLFW